VKQNLARILADLLIFILFALVGIWGISILIDKPPDHIQKPTPATGQKNILLLGVNDFMYAPALQSVWLIIYFPTSSHVNFLPIYPGPPGTPEAFNRQIFETFALTEDGNLSEAFSQMISTRTGSWWHNVIIVDNITMVRGIDFFGEINLEGVDMDGLTMLDALPPVQENGLAALKFQSNVVQSLCQKTWETRERDFESLLSLSPQHIRSNVNLYEVLSDFNAIIRRESPLSCEMHLLAGNP